MMNAQGEKPNRDPGSSGAANKMMETKFEIEPPESLIVKMELAKSVPVELVLEKQFYLDEYSRQLVQEFITAPDISIPVTINPDTLPFALLTQIESSSPPPEKASISIRIIEKRNIRIKLKNLDFLKNIFGTEASMKLILFHDGALKNWRTEEMEIREYNDDVEASVWISEDAEALISQFGRKKRYRTAHGEVTSLTGNFTIQAKWTINPRPKSIALSTKLDRHQKFILAKSFDHTVDLVASNGQIFKVSKALLAAHSEKIERQLQFLMDEKTDARSYKAIKIFSGAHRVDGSSHCLDEHSLRAFVRFITMNSVAEPLKNPARSLELMMTASYNMVTEMETAMALILLAHPLEHFDVDTSACLYWFSSVKCEMNRGNENLVQFWDRLKVRALWNMKWTPEKELRGSGAIQELFPDKVKRENFLTSL